MTIAGVAIVLTASLAYAVKIYRETQEKNKEIEALRRSLNAYAETYAFEDADEELIKGEFYQFNLSSCIRQQNSLTAQFVSFSLANLANIFYPPPIFTIINLCLL